VLARKTRPRRSTRRSSTTAVAPRTPPQLISRSGRLREAVPALGSIELAHGYRLFGKPVITGPTRPSVTAWSPLLVNDATSHPRGGRWCSSSTRPSRRPRASRPRPRPRTSSPEQMWAAGGSPGGVAKDRVISTVGRRARHGTSRSAVRKDGFKAHLAVEPGHRHRHRGDDHTPRTPPTGRPASPSLEGDQ